MKKFKFIASLFVLPLIMSLSACGGYAPHSGGEYQPSTFNPTHSNPDEHQGENIASGKEIFDFLLNPGSSFNFNNMTDPERFSVEGVEFIKADKEDLYTASIGGKNVDASSLYLADVNFDGHRDICVGTITETATRETYLSVAIYDVYNNNRLLELKDNGNFDYDFDLENGDLIIEEMPYVSKGGRRSVSRVGRFIKNSAQPNHLEWESNGYQLTGIVISHVVVCVEDNSVANSYRDTNGNEIVVLNTTNTFKLSIGLSHQGDYSQNTKQKGDCITFELSDAYVATFASDLENGTFIYNLSFSREGKYTLKASIEKFDGIIQIEVNNTLYDQLKVA